MSLENKRPKKNFANDNIRRLFDKNMLVAKALKIYN